MDQTTLRQEWIDRANNFHGDHEMLAKIIDALYVDLQMLFENIEAESFQSHDLSKEYLLKTVFSKVYHLIIARNGAYAIFDEETRIYDDVFNACFFTSLCMFMHDTKRIKGLSLSEFIYHNSPTNYQGDDSTNKLYSALKSLLGNNAEWDITNESKRVGVGFPVGKPQRVWVFKKKVTL